MTIEKAYKSSIFKIYLTTKQKKFVKNFEKEIIYKKYQK